MNPKPTVSQLSQWRSMSAFTGYRLSIILVLGAFLLLPLPAPEKSQLFTLAAIQTVYAVLVVGVLTTAAEKLAISTGAGIVSLLMVAFIVVVAVTMETSEAALLLFVPILNAAFRMSGRGMIAITVVVALSWVAIQAGSAPPTLWAMPKILAGLLPLLLTAYIVRALRDDNEITRGQLTELWQHDELSGVLNMRTFTRLLMSNHSNAEYANAPYALMMIDIESLRTLNERYGHEQGDRVILAVSDALKRSVRSNDLLARYGGDEFIVYLAGANKEVAETVRNRIKQNVYNISLSFSRSSERVEVSVGAAIYPVSGRTIQDMIHAADADMYSEKQFRRKTQSPDRPGDAGRRQAGVDA